MMVGCVKNTEEDPILGSRAEDIDLSDNTDKRERNTVEENPTCTRSLIIGFVFALLGSVLLAFSYGCVQYMGIKAQISILQLSTLRYASTALISSLLLIWECRRPVFQRSEWIPVVLMAGLSNLITIVVFRALLLAPIGTLAAISRLVIYNLSKALGNIFMNDGITKTSTGTVVIGAIGTILLIQPWYPDPLYLEDNPETIVTVSNHSLNHINNLYPEINKTHSRTYVYVTKLYHMTSDHPYAGILLVVLAGLLTAIEVVLHRKFIIHPDITSFYTSLSAGAFSLLLLVLVELPSWSHLTANSRIMFIYTASIGVATQLLLRAKIMTAIEMLSIASSVFIVCMFVGQYTLLDDIISGYKNVPEVLGAVLIVIGLNLQYIVNTFRMCRKKN